MRALSAIDIALWDIVGKSCGLPLYRLMGCYREEIPGVLQRRTLPGGFY